MSSNFVFIFNTVFRLHIYKIYAFITRKKRLFDGNFHCIDFSKLLNFYELCSLIYSSNLEFTQKFNFPLILQFLYLVIRTFLRFIKFCLFKLKRDVSLIIGAKKMKNYKKTQL